MKKIISILLTAVLLGTMLSVFVLPASAEETSAEETSAEEEPTEIEPINNQIAITNDGNYILKVGKYLINDIRMGINSNCSAVLTIPKGAEVTAEGYFSNFGTIYVYGTLNLIVTIPYDYGTIYEVCDGSVKGRINSLSIVKIGHVYGSNGICKGCGKEHDHTYQLTTVYRCECGKEAPANSVPGGAGSILSGGSLAIICSVVSAVVFLAVGALGMYLVMKKKKPVLAGEKNEE